MVALAYTTATRSSDATRARAPRCIDLLVVISSRNLNAAQHLAANSPAFQNQSESCSRAPVGYYEKAYSLYHYVSGKPLHFVDPFGFQDMFPYPPGGQPGGSNGPQYYWPPNFGAKNYDAVGDAIERALLGMCVGCDTCNYFEKGCDPDTCAMEAQKIAQSIEETLERHYRWSEPVPPLPWDQRFQGFYCYEWAWGFEEIVWQLGGSCFSGRVREATHKTKTERIHNWLEISSKCSDSTVYVDDSFANGDFCHYERPIPPNYEGNTPSSYCPLSVNPDPLSPEHVCVPVTPYGPHAIPLPKLPRW